MGDRAFAKTRAAGKNATEAGQARAKAGADIALKQNIGTRKVTRELNVSRTQPSWQPSAGGATNAQTPTPPAACDRNALSALGSNNLT